MKKLRVILVSCAAAAGAFVVVGAVMAFLGFGKASEAADRADSAVRDIKKIYAGANFPSSDNIATAESNVKRREGWTKALAAALDEGSVPEARNVSPGTFSQMREKAIERMASAAPAGEDGAPVVPQNFAFGFDRYASGIPAEKQHVGRLVRQLKLMETFVGMLYDAGIVRLEGAGREIFEDSAEGGDSSGEDFAVRRRPRGGSTSSGSGSIAIPPLPALEGPVEIRRDRFAFQFAAKEAALVSFLDAVDAMRPYAMVTSLSIEKLRPDVVFPEEAEKETRAAQPSGGGEVPGGRVRRDRRRHGAPGPDAPAALPPPQVVLNERPAPRSSRLVSGPLREAPVRAVVYVDVCSVPSARAAAETAAPDGEDESGEED